MREERNGHTCETVPDGACLPCIADTLKREELCGGHPIATCGEGELAKGTLPDSRRAITGDLVVLREYSCGCIVYLDAKKQEINEKGIFCGHNAWPKHRAVLVRGEETQDSLFAAG